MKKSNLNLPATKGDLRKLATKKELKLEIGRLDQKISFVVGGAKDELKDEFKEALRATESRILEAIDDFAKEIETTREERVIAAHQQDRLGKQLENHERRIVTLEKQKFTAPA